MIPQSRVDVCDPVLSDVTMLTWEEAAGRIVAKVRPITEREMAPLLQINGRVLAEDLVACRDVPAQPLAAMDGYAVAAADVMTDRATRLKLGQPVATGSAPASLAPGHAVSIGTGGALPLGTDAVVMWEKAKLAGDHIWLGPAVVRGQNVRPAGSELAHHQLVIPKGTKLNGTHAGIAAALGLTELPVIRRLRVAVVTTGSELLRPGAQWQPGMRYDSNGFLMHSLLGSLGCEVVTTVHAPDDFAALRDTLAELAKCADVIMTSGGVSMGAQDYVRKVISVDGSLDVWRVAIKPGKPLAFGSVQGVPVLALPGNPGALLVTFCVLARPFLLACQSQAVDTARWLWGRARFALETKARAEFVPVRVEASPAGENDLSRTGPHDAARLLSFAEAHAIAHVPSHQVLQSGQRVRFMSLPEML